MGGGHQLVSPLHVQRVGLVCCWLVMGFLSNVGLCCCLSVVYLVCILPDVCGLARYPTSSCLVPLVEGVLWKL